MVREPIMIVLPWIPPAGLRGNSTVHRAVKAALRKNMRTSAFQSTLDVDGPVVMPFGKVRVTYEYHNYRPIDSDNFAIGMKSWVDGYLVDGGKVADDDPEHVIYGTHAWVRCKKWEKRTIVTLEEVSP